MSISVLYYMCLDYVEIIDAQMDDYNSGHVDEVQLFGERGQRDGSARVYASGELS